MKNIILKTILKTIIATILTSSIILASGWRLPEQSATSVALSGAYVANAYGAEASYFNPANMSFNENKKELEFSLMAINLPSINYKDNAIPFKNSNSEVENFFVPTVFFTSEAMENMGNIRYGFSMSVPGGLSKKWEDTYAKLYAQEFTLEIIELNPVISYLISPELSIAGGLRAIYSKGIVKNDGSTLKPVSRTMEGNTIEYGYNVALAYKPNKTNNLSFTYRSNIDLKEKGNAKLYLSGTKVYDGGANVNVPLPAVLSLAYSIQLDKTNIEIEYDRTYWSAYEKLDFEYNSPVILAIRGAYDAPKNVNWKDTNAFRIGITQSINSDLDIMIGYAIDENPAPEQHIGFELPDSDASLYSIGANYKFSDSKSLGIGYLFDMKDSRKVKNNDIDGEFTNAKAHLISFAYRMAF